MPPIPADVLTPAQQQLAAFEGTVIGLLSGAIVLLVICAFLAVRILSAVEGVQAWLIRKI